MQTSLLKKLTLVVLIASTYAITGCSDANSKNASQSQNNIQPSGAINTDADPAAISAPNTPSKEESKRGDDAPSAIY